MFLCILYSNEAINISYKWINIFCSQVVIVAHDLECRSRIDHIFYRITSSFDSSVSKLNWINCFQFGLTPHEDEYKQYKQVTNTLEIDNVTVKTNRANILHYFRIMQFHDYVCDACKSILSISLEVHVYRNKLIIYHSFIKLYFK